MLKNKDWKDEFMRWNPSDYDNITQIKLPFNLIWIPGKKFYLFSIGIFR